MTMSRKYIDQILTTTLKYFFDLDYNTLLHSLTAVVIAIGLCKLACMWVKNEWHDGVATIKEDAVIIKSHLNNLAVKADAKEQVLYDFVKDQYANLRNVRERLAS